jgi:2-polyprenyl-3-methyl-5-hydroxy-6-metoxy-1,4-benzoquinol methylase
MPAMAKATTQEQVRDWWNRNPMSYDVDEPIPHPYRSRAWFEVLDSRVFHPRVLRLTVDPKDGRPFSRFVDFEWTRGKSVLEVGPGSGIAVQIFAQAGANITAVDLTEWAVESVRARLEAFGLEGTARQGDAQDLDLEDASFDMVFSWGVIMMGTDMDKALDELVRVLKPGGRLVLMLYHRHSLFFPFYRGLARFLPLARRFHLHFEGAREGERDGLLVRHVTRREVESLLTSRGLTNVRVQPYGQDSELLPLPRKIRVPITDRVPLAFKDWALNRVGHQLAITADKPAAA